MWSDPLHEGLAELVGPSGLVYAVDIHKLAISAVEKQVHKHDFSNVRAVLAQSYESGIAPKTADIVCALDMFFSIEQPTAFLCELARVVKPSGVLLIDNGHQPRERIRIR